MSEFKFADLFAGIGGFRLALESVGGECVELVSFCKDILKTFEKHDINGHIVWEK